MAGSRTTGASTTADDVRCITGAFLPVVGSIILPFVVVGRIVGISATSTILADTGSAGMGSRGAGDGYNYLGVSNIVIAPYKLLVDRQILSAVSVSKFTRITGTKTIQRQIPYFNRIAGSAGSILI
ncbi:MAG: hypothetical protein U0L11_07420 [Acutalibacteraceae bacterium]|nr:hypothetical protein [Acutalibacteraceae bacterium]